ncbi:hypothetical protein BA171_04130 [Candidatus Hamiltonella defensa (Bemisia tabaci)]|uniref:Uncharacterized protein n=3 Tax=Candidatus Williamhamiltonella defendens TaxID=138072 RepID=A0A249DXL3_9ENTR|nr:hypothetical protein BA171_04130 [Candidatus Hamiltonella defensa (Bemisia tabaci)]
MPQISDIHQESSDTKKTLSKKFTEVTNQSSGITQPFINASGNSQSTKNKSYFENISESLNTVSTCFQYATNLFSSKSDPEQYPAPTLSNIATNFFNGSIGLIKTAHKVSTGDLNVDVPAAKENFKKVTKVFSDCMKVRHNFSEASNYRKEHARLVPYFKESKITSDKEADNFVLLYTEDVPITD